MATLLNQFIDKSAGASEFNWVLEQLGNVKKQMDEINAAGINIEMKLKGTDDKSMYDLLVLTKDLKVANDQLASSAARVTSSRSALAAAARNAAKEHDALVKSAEKEIEVLRKEQAELNKSFQAIDKVANKKKQTADAQIDRQLARDNALLAKEIENLRNQMAMAEKEIAAVTAQQEKQLAAIRKDAEAYRVLDSVHKDLLNSARNIGAEFGVESKQFIEAAARANSYGQKLSEIDARLGVYRRNVGNYASAWNGLSYSINNITSEFPNLSQSTEIFFRSISNNIMPIAQQIGMIREENARLIAQGQAAVPVWKQLGAAIMSWQTALSVGVAIAVDFFPKFIDWLTDAAGKAKELAIQQAENVDYLKKINDHFNTNGKIIDANEELTLSRLKARGATEKQLNDERIKYANQRLEAAKVENQVLKIQRDADEQWYKHVKETGVYDAASVTAAANKLQASQEALKRSDDNLISLRNKPEILANEGNASSLEKQKQARDKSNAARLRSIEQMNALELQLGEELTKQKNEQLRSQLETEKKYQQLIIQDETTTAEQRMAARWSFYAAAMQLAKLEESDAIAEEERKHARRVNDINASLVSERRKNALLLLENRRHANALLAVWEDYSEKITQSQNSYESGQDDDIRAGQQGSINRGMRIATAGIKNYKGPTKEAQDAWDKLTAKINKANNALQSFANAGKQLVDVIYQPQLNAQDEIIHNIEISKDAEIARINATAKTDKDAKQQIATLEANNLQAIQAAEREKKRIKREQAQIDKTISIMQIITSTGVAVMNALGAKPYTPANIALSVAAGATGAAQLATAIAAPLPQYYKGVEKSPATWAIVGELGPELKIDKHGNVSLTPGEPTVTYLEQGTTIVPADRTKEIMRAVQGESMMDLMGVTVADNAHYSKMLADVYVSASDRTATRIVAAIKQKNTSSGLSTGSAFFDGPYKNKYKN